MRRRAPRAQAWRLVGTLAVWLGTAGLPRPAHADLTSCISDSEAGLQLRQQGKLRDALKRLAACADASCPAEVSTECTQRIAGITAAMPTLILSAKDGAGNDLSAVTVFVDGAPFAAKLDGLPLPIDPGAHVIRFETAGQPPLEKQIVVREGEKNRSESVVIGKPPAVAPATTPAAAPPPPRDFWSTQRTLAVVSGGVGVLGVAVGTIFGVAAISAKNREKDDCGATCTNFPGASDAYTSAGHDATGSTVAFVAGGAFLVASAVLWLTSPTRDTREAASAARPLGVLGVAPTVESGAGVRARGLVLEGEF